MATSITTAQQKAISELYVAFFNRAADSEGLGFWANGLANGQSIEAIAQSMYLTAPARAYYSTGLTNEQFIEAFYTTVLGRATPDAEGVAFWTAALNQPNATQGSVAVQIMKAVRDYVDTPSSPTNAVALTAKALFAAKVDVSTAYALHGGDAAGASAVLSGVVDAATAAEAIANLGSGTIGSTFTLTTGQDDLIGTTSNDTFKALVVENNLGDSAQTIQSFDHIDGGNGTDTLIATILDDVNIDTTSVEVLNLKTTEADITVGIAADVTTLINTSTEALAITGAAGLATITTAGAVNLDVSGMKATSVTLNVAHADNTVSFLAAGTAKVAETLAVNFDGTLAVDSALTKALTVTANGAGSFSDADGNDTADSFTLTSATPVTATINGNGDVYVDLGSAAKLTTFDASALVGGVDAAVAGDATTSVLATVNGGQGNDSLHVTNLKDGGAITLNAGDDVLDVTTAKGAFTIDGGTGNDDITIDAVVASKAAVINGGDGNDTIDTSGINYAVTGTTLTVNGGAGNDYVIAGALIDAVSTVKFDGGAGDADVINITDGLDLASAKSFSNFEVLDVTGSAGADYDMSRESSLNAVLVNGYGDAGTGIATLLNVAAGTTVEARDGAVADITYTLDDASGTADSVSVSLTANDSANKAIDATATTGLNSTLTLTVDGVETIDLHSTVQVGTNTSTEADALQIVADDYEAHVLTLSSDTATTVNVDGNAKVTIDLSDATAVTKVDAHTNTGGVEVTLTSADASEFIGGAGVDTVTAGNADTVITGNGGGDSLTAGALTTFVYKAAADSALALNAKADALVLTGMDSIVNFGNYDSVTKLGDRIDLTAFNFSAAKTQAIKTVDIGALDAGGDAADLFALLKTAANGKDFFHDTSTTNAVAVWESVDASYIFVDANKDGNFTAADMVIAVTGASDAPVLTDFIFIG